MSQFTKAELEELSFWLNRLAMMENTLDNLKPIHRKINDMIDSYCDHDVREGKRGEDTVFYCIKCENEEWF